LVAHVVVFALFFQIAAVDHWHADPGIDAALHASHCHGAASGCADSPSLAGTLTDSPLVVAKPAWWHMANPGSLTVPGAAFIALPDLPPRAWLTSIL
jgi:hypothetical protein